MEKQHLDLASLTCLDSLRELVCHVNSKCTFPGTATPDRAIHLHEVGLEPLRELDGDLVYGQRVFAWSRAIGDGI